MPQKDGARQCPSGWRVMGIPTMFIDQNPSLSAGRPFIVEIVVREGRINLSPGRS